MDQSQNRLNRRGSAWQQFPIETFLKYFSFKENLLPSLQQQEPRYFPNEQRRIIDYRNDTQKLKKPLNILEYVAYK